MLKVAYLGNWMANAWRIEDKVKEYESIEHYLFSLAPTFGFEKFVEHEEIDGNAYYPSRSFEETTDVEELHEAYDEDTFWDELVNRLGDRDFFSRYSLEQIKSMTDEERYLKRSECAEWYIEEINEYGLERISVTEEKTDELTKDSKGKKPTLISVLKSTQGSWSKDN